MIIKIVAEAYGISSDDIKSKVVTRGCLYNRPTVEIGGKHFCTYTADFVYFDVALGREVIEDSKSTGTAKDAAYRLRKKAAQLHHRINIDEVIS